MTSVKNQGGWALQLLQKKQVKITMHRKVHVKIKVWRKIVMERIRDMIPSRWTGEKTGCRRFLFSSTRVFWFNLAASWLFLPRCSKNTQAYLCHTCLAILDNFDMHINQLPTHTRTTLSHRCGSSSQNVSLTCPAQSLICPGSAGPSGQEKKSASPSSATTNTPWTTSY